MNLSAPFIARPIATSLVAAALLLAGAGAFTQMPVAPLPRVDFPTISVSVGLPGASPETMASSVATPLERRFGRIAGLTEMTSTSSLGSSNITLQFDLDRDVESAARDVQAAINAAGGDLPPGLPTRPTYRKVNPADSPVLIIALTSKTLPLAQVFDTANSILAQKIAQVDGVGQVMVGGGQQPAVRVQADPEALASRGLGLEDVRTALAAQTVDSPKGAIGDAWQAQVIHANDQLVGAHAWSGAVIAAQNGAVVRLADIAKVTDSVENQRVAGWTDGERAVSLVVRRQPGANIIAVIDKVKATLPELAAVISPAIEMKVSLDRAQTIRESVHDVEASLLLSVVLVVLVVFVFLRNLRATLIPSIAVPLSLCATFGMMYLCGYSLDNLSLMALTISTGFVVDDAIVVTENIARLVEEGVPAREAARRGAAQIGFTILSITLSLVAVFIPILFMGGVVGRLFREFAITLAVAISLSGIISLTITPSMCAQLLQRKQAAPGRVAALLERAYARLEGGYAAALRFVLRHRILVGLSTVGIMGVTVFLYFVVPKGLFPQQDSGLLMGTSDAPQDISYPAMKQRQEALNKALAGDPDVEHYNSSIGSGFGGGGGNTGTFFIALRRKPPRKATADQVIGRLRSKLAGIPGINLYLQSVQDVRIGGRLARTQYQYTLQDADLAELATWAPRLFAKLRQLPELRDVATDQQTGGLRLLLTVDREKAARLGVTMAAIDSTLNDAFGQRQVATTYTQTNPYRVVLEVDPDAAQGPESIDRLFVPGIGSDGAAVQVPLASLVQRSIGATTLSVSHQSQFAAVTLSFNTAPGVALSQAVEAVHQAELEVGLPATIHGGFQGTAQAFRDSMASQPLLILAALLTVYIVLGMLYESFIHPITILSTLPSAGLGALLALLITGTELSVIALIGIILLIGIVKKNAIMMIDFALDLERSKGLSPAESIYQACVLRFRPILMTTLAALLGAVPLAVATGTGSELRRPLGIAIVGGLLLSQLLTLFTTPVTYLAFTRLTHRRAKPATPAPVPAPLPASAPAP